MSKASFHPGGHTAFADAERFLAGGRDKSRRTVQNNTKLCRVNDDTIALVLHQTPVVTYHRSGEQVIWSGGWNTPTTKDRISTYSSCRPGSDGKGMWVLGWTGENTPPKVQKCRTCRSQNPTGNGLSTWVTNDYCYGPSYWDKQEGRAECYHGFTAKHVTGVSAKSCSQCNGTGRYDYGSKRIPILVNPDEPFVVDADGVLVDSDLTRPNGYFNATTRSRGFY